MKPLILWARGKYPQPYLLRMGAHTAEAVSGEVKIDGVWLPFHFDSRTLEIRLGEGADARAIRINEWGWEQ